MVGNELEAAHQFVPPAKYLAADRRMSRSVANLTCSARKAVLSARNRASSCSGGPDPDPTRPPLPESVLPPAVSDEGEPVYTAYSSPLNPAQPIPLV